jgi:adenylate cyclase
MGGFIMRSIGRKQSNLNPHFCNICEDFAKMYPGGAEVEMSMLFVDVRGSTALSEQMTAIEFQKMINRFYVGATNAIAESLWELESMRAWSISGLWGQPMAWWIFRQLVRK